MCKYDDFALTFNDVVMTTYRSSTVWKSTTKRDHAQKKIREITPFLVKGKMLIFP